MNSAFYSAASGLSTYQTGIDVRANNIANINTTAFKTQRAMFTEALYSYIFRTEHKNGGGVHLDDTAKNFNLGMLYETERNLDAAIQGNGFFAVSDGEGIYYTRDGSFSLYPVEEGFVLATANGDVVLDSSLNPVTYNGNIENIVYTSAAADASLEEVNVGVFVFENSDALSFEGNGKYAPTDGSGDAEVIEDVDILQGRLERSNVDLANEMTRIIELQRAFQLNARMLQAADEIENTANNLR